MVLCSRCNPIDFGMHIERASAEEKPSMFSSYDCGNKYCLEDIPFAAVKRDICEPTVSASYKTASLTGLRKCRGDDSINLERIASGWSARADRRA